jgi:hypothetical protein
MKKKYLTVDHCEEVMRKELIIGSDRARDGKTKTFTFHIWDNEYTITHGGTVVETGQAVEELLEVYNAL